MPVTQAFPEQHGWFSRPQACWDEQVPATQTRPSPQEVPLQQGCRSAPHAAPSGVASWCSVSSWAPSRGPSSWGAPSGGVPVSCEAASWPGSGLPSPGAGPWSRGPESTTAGGLPLPPHPMRSANASAAPTRAHQGPSPTSERLMTMPPCRHEARARAGSTGVGPVRNRSPIRRYPGRAQGVPAGPGLVGVRRARPAWVGASREELRKPQPSGRSSGPRPSKVVAIATEAGRHRPASAATCRSPPYSESQCGGPAEAHTQWPPEQWPPQQLEET
jgi:hypothetical protein